MNSKVLEDLIPVAFTCRSVQHVEDFWDGVIFEDSCLPGGMLKLRVALLALCCDVPAARKCGGFAGHSAAKETCLVHSPHDDQ